MPQAAGLAAAIKKRFGTEVELIKGGGGIFDVRVDGDLIYSRAETGRFPEDREILDKITGLSETH